MQNRSCQSKTTKKQAKERIMFALKRLAGVRYGSTLTNETVKTFKGKTRQQQEASFKNVQNKKLKKKRRTLEESVSFEDFVLKGQVLHFYRDILRSVHKIPDATLRKEVLDFVKGEFRATAGVTDLNIKRSLLIGGIRQWKSVSNNMGLSYTEIVF